MSIFYEVIIQTVLLYGAETWVLSEGGKNKINSFHNRCARFITGRFITKLEDDTWVCPDTKTTLEMADLLPIEEYIERRKNTISEYAISTNIFHDCIQKSKYIKSDNSLEWWKNLNNTNKTVFDVAEIPVFGSDF